MSRIKNKVRKSLLTATVLFMAIFLFAGSAWADDYQPGKKGSITIRLNDIGSYKGNVEICRVSSGKACRGKQSSVAANRKICRL